MNWLDMFLIMMAAMFVVQGLWKGFSRQAVGLVATLIGIMMGVWCYGTAASFLLPYVSSRAVANVVGFLIIFGLVQMVGALVAWILSKVFEVTGLSWLDRLMGGAFGMVKAGLMAVAFVLVLTAFPIKEVPSAVAESRFAPYVVEASHVLIYAAPRELKDGFLSTYDRLKQFWLHDLRRTPKLPRATA